MKNFEYHELCLLFPPADYESTESLRDSIKKNGLMEPVTMFDGKVLDGRNRVLACRMANIEPATVEYSGDDPLGFVLAKNLSRRHLNESQRAMIAAKIADLPPHRPAKNKGANLHFVPTIESASKAVSVSSRSTATAKKVLREADPDTIKEIEAGKKSVSKAVKELKDKKSPPANPKAERSTGAGPTLLEQSQESGSPTVSSFGRIKPESEPVPNPVLLANEKEASIIAAIQLIGREIKDYCDIAPEEMLAGARRRFIRAFCDLFDPQDVKRVASKL